MKKILTLICASVLCTTLAFAQRSHEEYVSRYKLLTDRLGAAGVGVETLLNSWEADWPEDVDMLCGKFSYYFAKSQSIEVVRKDQEKFLGAAPVITLKDSTGAPVYYFQETMYDDDLFALSAQYIDRAIRLKPDEIDLRFNRITALISYEKESPDMAVADLRSIIDWYYTSGRKVMFREQEVDNDFFCAAVQEYCYTFFLIGSPVSMEAFRSLSEKMLDYNPGSPLFMDNIGSYHFVWKKDNRTAEKYYTKVLKKHPDDYTAVRNLVLMYRRAKDFKKEKKYLARLSEISSDETEKAAAKARYEALNSKKK